MSADRVGLELLADRVRAVALGRFGDAPRATLELSWDPERPAAAVDALAARLGRPRRVAFAVGLAFVHVARVTLPPLPAPDRRRALALDPSRHFPVDEPVAVALLGDVAPPAAGDGEPAFAVRRALLDRWLDAFGAWAPIECVEAAPTSIARVLGTSDDATYTVPAAEGETGAMEWRGGRMVSVRRVPAALDEAGSRRDLPDVRGVDGPWLAAWGAARGIDEPADVQLVGGEAARALGARRVRRVATAAVVCGAALGLALASLDRARERRLAWVDAEIAAAAPRAAPAESLLARIGALDAAARGADALGAGSPSVPAVLAALGERLPADAAVQALRVRNDEWEISGTARAAAAIVPALDADPRLVDVRATAPSSRTDGAGESAGRETFAVSFRARGTR
ncbi:hypothetical protein J421_4407 [Gemmatirosa kalamazoonensis]|uniref:Fimbrial assembly family protein n=1 Tax=Gemmatirosa kalamazoonensis TaxID=861299 RepID=W0RLI2_9BACT|nr:PilN domain-containing protein [Gemmatirosa kalamazoonensis]AHG91944.1 hypothetical protein J421_4407 [Gemmatirosa kalamazoonensis]